MHEYLRDWREFRGLSQEAVGLMLGRNHSTIGRWESGAVSLTAKDLQRLAEIYEATALQIVAHPKERDRVAMMERMQRIVDKMDAETVEHWLSTGERLGR